MPQRDYVVTVVFNYTVEWDEEDIPPEADGVVIDDDYLHDAIRDNFDTVDLEFNTEHPLYDEKGDELDDQTLTLNVNAYNIRELEVDGG